MEQQVKRLKPLRMFVYLPVYLIEKKPGRPPADGVKPELQKIVIQDKMQFVPGIKTGDIFALKKRNDLKEFLNNEDETKVEQVKYNFVDGSCLVILEKLVFTDRKEMSEFLKNKRGI